MQKLNKMEIKNVTGGMNDWTAHGMTAIGIGFSGGPATAAFELAVGGAMMLIGYYAER